MFQDEIYTPLDLAEQQKHGVVVDYLRVCSAKRSTDYSPAEIEEWFNTFESQVAEAKNKRNRQLNVRRRDRRPSTTDGVSERAKEIVDVGVNTSERSTKSADGNRRKYSKSTSVTNLMQVPSVPKQELEALKASIENGKKLVDEEDEDHIDILDVDDEFENLPPISDLSSSTSSLESDKSDKSDKSEAESKVTVKEAVPSALKKTEKKTKKEVRIESAVRRKKVRYQLIN